MMSFKNDRRCGVIVSWALLFFLAIGIRVVLGSLGEFICSSLLIWGTTFAYIFWQGPGRFNSSHENEGNVLRRQLIDNEHGVLFEDITSVENNENDHEENNNAMSSNTDVENERAESTSRVLFLDNVKVFLTSLVVTHHVACAFGGCGEGSWYLITGFDGPPIFVAFVRTLPVLNQSFFMSLFFFISGYFVPSSYEKGGGWKEFKSSKRKRLVFPALLVTFLVSPVSILISGTSKSYIPNPGPAWFLFWLLLFNLVYVSCTVLPESLSPPPGGIDVPSLNEEISESPITEEFQSHSSGTSSNGFTSSDTGIQQEDDLEDVVVTAAEEESVGFPSTPLRLGCGIVICGVSLLPFLILIRGTFASMPVSYGSMTCDFFMFYLGLQAEKNRWLQKPLKEHLDIDPMVLAFSVSFEGISIAIMTNFSENNWLGIPLVLVAGMFCLDMSLLVLFVFQRWMDFETKFTRFLAKGAYGVYLLHPIIVTSMTVLYIRIFDKLEGGQDGDEGRSAYFYPIGFVFVNVLSHLINWPLAYFVAQLPWFNEIL